LRRSKPFNPFLKRIAPPSFFYFFGGSDQKCQSGILLRGGAESKHKASIEGLSQGSEEPENSGGLDMIRWPRRQEARPLEPRIRVNPRLLELQTAKEILGEIFHARPG
jgi:hypothetical protein